MGARIENALDVEDKMSIRWRADANQPRHHQCRSFRWFAVGGVCLTVGLVIASTRGAHWDVGSSRRLFGQALFARHAGAAQVGLFSKPMFSRPVAPLAARPAAFQEGDKHPTDPGTLKEMQQHIFELEQQTREMKSKLAEAEMKTLQTQSASLQQTGKPLPDKKVEGRIQSESSDPMASVEKDRIEAEELPSDWKVGFLSLSVATVAALMTRISLAAWNKLDWRRTSTATMNALPQSTQPYATTMVATVAAVLTRVTVSLRNRVGWRRKSTTAGNGESNTNHSRGLVALAPQRLGSHAQMSAAAAQEKKIEKRGSGVYALILANMAVFVADKIVGYPFIRKLYLWHGSPIWWQTISSCFCHDTRDHLTGNMFLLLLFGRSVEDDVGWFGLLFSFLFCGVIGSVISLTTLPTSAVSLGASGAVYGLFTISTLAKLSWRSLDWKRVIEFLVLGTFMLPGINLRHNHVAHLSGACAGVVMVLLLKLKKAKKTSIEQSSSSGRGGNAQPKSDNDDMNSIVKSDQQAPSSELASTTQANLETDQGSVSSELAGNAQSKLEVEHQAASSELTGNAHTKVAKEQAASSNEVASDTQSTLPIEQHNVKNDQKPPSSGMGGDMADGALTV